MKKISIKVFPFVLFYFSIVLCIGLICFYWTKTNEAQEEIISLLFINRPAKEELAVKLLELQNKPIQKTVKGIYLTGYSASSQSKIEEVINLLNRTELNAVVVDIKDYSGVILYDSGVFLANELGTDEDRIKNIKKLIDKLHEQNIYVIARETVFQDPILAQKKPEWAIKNKQGNTWRDRKGLAWVDPANKEVWNYNIEIAKEAIGLGFDEINFDYVRFPSDGDLSNIANGSREEERISIMRNFYHYLSDELSNKKVWISLDMFGFVMEHNTGLSIGQRLEDAVNEVDFICPMMYPSHYPAGYLGFQNPAEHPGEVIENGIKKGLPKFDGTRAKFRPWIQAFNMGAVYDSKKIRTQIDMVEKYSNDGWLLWNASNKYSDVGLKAE